MSVDDPKTCEDCGCELADDEENFCDDCLYSDEEFDDEEEE